MGFQPTNYYLLFLACFDFSLSGPEATLTRLVTGSLVSTASERKIILLTHFTLDFEICSPDTRALFVTKLFNY